MIYTDALLNQAIELYRSGKSFQQVGTDLGVNGESIRVALRDRGVKLPRNTYTSKRRIPINPDAIERYRMGESEYAISKSLGISRNVIRRWIEESGVIPRDRSEAGFNRAARMTAAERQAQASFAQNAWRGSKWTRTAKLHKAETIYAKTLAGTHTRSHLELQLGDWLTERGVEFTPEQIVDCYNIDFGIEPVAVELLGGNWHAAPNRRAYHAERTHDILNAGWSMIFVWSTSYGPINPWAADKIVSLLEEARRNPTPIGQYWVIRGDGELVATGGDEGNDFTLVSPSHTNFRRWP